MRLSKALIFHGDNQILNIDSKTEVSMPESLKTFEKNKNYNFIKLNISDSKKLERNILKFKNWTSEVKSL